MSILAGLSVIEISGHGAAAIKELLGLSNADVERLQVEGVIGGSVKAFV